MLVLFLLAFLVAFSLEQLDALWVPVPPKGSVALNGQRTSEAYLEKPSLLMYLYSSLAIAVSNRFLLQTSVMRRT